MQTEEQLTEVGLVGASFNLDPSGACFYEEVSDQLLQRVAHCSNITTMSQNQRRTNAAEIKCTIKCIDCVLIMCFSMFTLVAVVVDIRRR